MLCSLCDRCENNSCNSTRIQIKSDTVSEMDEDLNQEAAAYTLQNSLEALLSIQRLDFKTSFLEVVEELRMRREAEIHYEKQISRFIIEKQELEWQKEALQYQIETLNKQHSEALAAFKKQFQARIFAIEEEKGRYLLAEESKEREIEGLKETLKMLQISKYSLQNKLNEMEQTLQLHMLAKEDHQKSLNEVEKCYAVITCQFGTIKGAHERLEQNVLEAIQLNKKLTKVNKRQESEIDNFKKELKKVTEDLIRSNVTCQQKAGEENLSLTAKEQELQKLQQKLSMETELKTKITEENEHLKKEKEEIITSLQHMQQLLCRQTETNIIMEKELNELKQKYQTLERDNELQREKAKENEEKFLNLQHEYEKAQATWKNAAELVSTENEMHISQKENIHTQEATEVSNNLELEKMRVKNTVTCSLDSDEIYMEQNYADINAEEINLISVEDLNYLEKCTNEDDTTCLCKQNQREASESKPACMLSFITPGLTSGSCVAVCEKAAANEGEDNFLSNEICAKVEIKPPYSCRSTVPVKDYKMLQETLISKTNENISNVPREGSFTNEPLTKESKVQDNTASEKTTNNHSKTKDNSVMVSQTIEHNHPTFYSDSLKQSSDISNTEKMSPNQSPDCVTSNINIKINTYNEEIHIDDLCKNNKCDLSSTCNTPENIPHSHTSFHNSEDLNIHVDSDENTHNMALERNLNVNVEELSNHIDVCQMPKKQLEESLRLPGMSTNAPKHTIVLPLSTESESQALDLQMETITISKQKEFHAFKTTTEQFLEVCDKETTLLKDKEKSLCGTVTGEMTKEENMEELCSSSIKTSGDLLNGNGKSSFDLPSKNKTINISACLDLPGGFQGNDGEIIHMHLEKKEPRNNQLSRQEELRDCQGKNASTSMNRTADTLNTGGINPDLKRNPTDEWNAIAKTFYEAYFPTESGFCADKKNSLDLYPTLQLLRSLRAAYKLLPFLFPQQTLYEVKTQCPPCLQQKSSQFIFEQSALVSNESSRNSEERDWNSQNVFIRTKLNSIEKFLYLEKFCQPRKRKYEGNPDKTMTASKAEM